MENARRLWRRAFCYLGYCGIFDMSHSTDQSMSAPYNIKIISFGVFSSARSGFKKETKPTPISKIPKDPRGKLLANIATITIKTPATKERGLRSIKPFFIQIL